MQIGRLVFLVPLSLWELWQRDGAKVPKVAGAASVLTVSGPRVTVEQVSRRITHQPGVWMVGWDIRNDSSDSLEIVNVAVPHGRFRGQEADLRLALWIPPWESHQLELRVACAGEPGTTVENAFLILSVKFEGEDWRILVRLSVDFNDSGEPHTRTERVTVQKVGFSRQ